MNRIYFISLSSRSQSCFHSTPRHYLSVMLYLNMTLGAYLNSLWCKQFGMFWQWRRVMCVNFLNNVLFIMKKQ